MSSLNVDSKSNDAASKMVVKDFFGSVLSEMTELFQKLNVDGSPEVPEEDHSKLKFERTNNSHGSSFYGHDDRVYLQYDDDISSVAEIGISESERHVKNGSLKKDGRPRKLWTSRTVDVEDRWSHDLYVEEDQMPKTTQELIDTYGYDIRKQKSAPELKKRTLIVYNSKNKHEYHQRDSHLREYSSSYTQEHVTNKCKRFSEQRNRKLPEWYGNTTYISL